MNWQDYAGISTGGGGGGTSATSSARSSSSLVQGNIGDAPDNLQSIILIGGALLALAIIGGLIYSAFKLRRGS